MGQYGVGVKGGTEVAVHAVRLALTQLSPLSFEQPEEPVNDEGDVMHFNLAIATDVKNAFGEVHRAPIFRMIRDEFPELFEVSSSRTSLETTCSFESRRGGVPKVVLTEGIL